MTDAEIALMGLLLEQPRHGYELERVIDERGMRAWTDIGFSSIYYVLGRLEKAGLVVSQPAEAGGRGPSRKTYAPTREGAEAWTTASLDALASTDVGGRRFLLGLGQLPGLPPERVRHALAKRLDALTEDADALQRRRDELGGPWYVDALFDYTRTMVEAERAWVTRFADEYAEHEKGEVSVMPSKMKPLVPEIVELPARTVAAVHTTGDPGEVGRRAFPALYGAVYPLKFALKKQGVEFKVEPPRARWFGGPDWATLPRDEWKAAWGLPVPEGTDELKQKDPELPVVVETWEYGLVAQVLYEGAYSDETSTIEALHAFIADEGYEIAGPHEEEYLSGPQAKVPKTIIRYQVRKKTG